MDPSALILTIADPSHVLTLFPVFSPAALTANVSAVPLATAFFVGVGLMSIGNLFGDGDDDSGDSDEVVFDDTGGGDEFEDELGDLGEDDDWDQAEGNVGELEQRVDELETEIDEISSTMGTVRSENEEISESVEEVEDNVRKLLEIYEMVTQGVNPFVDEVQQGSGAGGFDDGGSFDVLGDDSGSQETASEGDIDDDVAEAEPEAFFDDDFEDEEDGFMDDDVGGFDDGDDLDEETEFDEDFDEDFDQDIGGDEFDDAVEGGEELDDTDQEPAPDDGGKSFEDLKSKYDSDADHSEATGQDERPGRNESPEDGDVPPQEWETPPEAPSAQAMSPQSSDRPYLSTLEGGYVNDLVVMEWLTFLVEETNTVETHRAIKYYEDIEWISEDVADHLENFVDGISDETRDEPLPARERLSYPGNIPIDVHMDSLRYISKLSSDHEREMLEMGMPGGPRSGGDPAMETARPMENVRR